MSVSVLLVIAGGIVGLASFWVGQRQREIGIRRALGASQSEILRHFMAENLLFTAAGIVVGGMLSAALSLWLVSRFEMSRMSVLYILGGGLLLLALGQLAAFMPARQASRIPPGVAIGGTGPRRAQ